MVPAFSPHTVVGRNTSARGRGVGANAPTATTKPTRVEPGASGCRSGKSVEHVGAEQHQRARRPSAGGGEDAGGVEAGARPGTAPTRSV